MINFLQNYSGTELIIVLAAYVLVIIISLAFHEFAHAYVAHKQGDDTPKAMGRLTLNPLPHIDIFGFLMILFLGFGWAKPVVTNPLKYRRLRKGSFLVSIAGVTVNLIFAFISYPLLMLLLMYGGGLPEGLFLFLYIFLHMMFLINIILFTFNLLPVYPLDGFRVIEAFAKYDNPYVKFMHKYGAFVLLGVLILLTQFNLLDYLIVIISAPITAFWNLIFLGVAI